MGASSGVDGQTALGDVAAGAAKRRVCLDDGFDSSHFRHIVHSTIHSMVTRSQCRGKCYRGRQVFEEAL